MPRAHIAYAHDIVMSAVAFVVSLWLRLGDGLLNHDDPQQLLVIGVVFVAVAAIALRTQGLYRGVWRYASVNDLIAIIRAVSLTVLMFMVIVFLMYRLEPLPRSFFVIIWFVMPALLGGPRFVYRTMKDRRFERILEQERPDRTRVLLAGAGDEAELFIRALQNRSHASYEVVGLLSDKTKRVGLSIHGKIVLGRLQDLEKVCAELGARKPEHLVLTRDFDRDTALALMKGVEACGITMVRIPRLVDFRDGHAEDVLNVRAVAIEDLLGREQRTLDRDSMRRLVGGRRVLVTGAGGSIGSELTRQIAALGPAHLVLADVSEYALYSIDQEMQDRAPDLSRLSLIVDVRDRGRIDQVFAAERPDLVFHAAALKHVPIVEEQPLEGVKTNILGTRNVADACRRHGVAAMVMISTDKAVNPTNVMGATKRVAEQYCQALDLLGTGGAQGPRFMSVRFGNVLGSTGSVVPLFQRQLEKGGPLTVTHPEVSRYFMTIAEAVELVLQAAALGEDQASYRGHVFVLDMGKPIRIADLARNMIRLSGRRVDEDVSIVYTGLRPGEKLYEEVFHGGEPLVDTGRDGILVASPRRVDDARLKASLEKLALLSAQGDEPDALGVLRELVEDYQPRRDDCPAMMAGAHGSEDTVSVG
nr:nucleoside-diphosphate sugar epimerase/dehydratase [Roseospira navarrensis]